MDRFEAGEGNPPYPDPPPLYDLHGCNGWTTSSSSGAIQVAQSAAPHGEQNAVFTNINSGANASKSITVLANNNDYYTFHIQPYFTNTAGGFALLLDVSGATESGVRFTYNGGTQNYHYYAWNDDNWSTSLGSFLREAQPENQPWETFTLYRISNTQYNLYRNDGLVSGGPFSFNNTNPSINTEVFMQAPGGADMIGIVSIDGIFMNPEPSTIIMMILSLGGLGLKCFKKKII